MACCLAAPSHYLHQCWLLISEVLWHSPELESNLTASYYHTFKLLWVKYFPKICTHRRATYEEKLLCYTQVSLHGINTLGNQYFFNPTPLAQNLLCRALNHSCFAPGNWCPIRLCVSPSAGFGVVAQLADISGCWSAELGPCCCQVKLLDLQTWRNYHTMSQWFDGSTHWPLGDVSIVKMWSPNMVWIKLSTPCEIALRWMPLDSFDDESTFVQVNAWLQKATSHYLSQCWSRSMTWYGVSRPQWVINFSAWAKELPVPQSCTEPSNYDCKWQTTGTCL